MSPKSANDAPPEPGAVFAPLIKRIVASLGRRCHVPRDAHLLLAVSGGADSVAMLRALHAIAQRRAWSLQLTVAHVHHHIRPGATGEQDADADAALVADLAREFGLPFVRADLDPNTNNGQNVEAWARRERYRALSTLARHVGSHYVVTAHHADDQLETLLMRMLRGASVKGLAGIAWRRRLAGGEGQRACILVRPMLCVDRADVCKYLSDLGQTWRHDHTNTDPTRWRARLRRDVLPVLHDLRPGAGARAVALADHLCHVASWLESQVCDVVKQEVTQAGDAIVIPRAAARKLPRAVVAGVLRHALLQAGAGADDVGQSTLEPIMRAVSDRRGGTRSFDIAHGITIELTAQHVRIFPSQIPPAQKPLL